METDINNKKHYKDISQNEFGSEVIEASKEFFVLVDFWAPWCGPCKDLGPRIEKIVSQNLKKLKLVKINIDENQEIAAQLQIQSIPTVFAFKDGKIANAFQGSLSEKDIIKFIEKASGEKLDGNVDEIIKDARNKFNENMFEESKELLEEAISSGVSNHEIFELLIKNNVSLNKIEEAKEIIDSLNDEMKNNQSVKSAISAYELASNPINDSLEDLIKLVENNLLDIKANKKLSDYYFNNKQYDEAFKLILDLFSKSKKQKRVEVREILIKYFNVLGNTHEKTKEARRKLSSMIFS